MPIIDNNETPCSRSQLLVSQEEISENRNGEQNNEELMRSTDDIQQNEENI